MVGFQRVHLYNANGTCETAPMVGSNIDMSTTPATTKINLALLTLEKVAKSRARERERDESGKYVTGPWSRLVQNLDLL